MANKKIDQALYGPSTLEVALGAGLGLVSGVIVAAGFLMLKPAQPPAPPTKDPAAAPAKGVVIYQPGKVDPNRGRGWRAKHDTLVQGGEVLLTEEELNGWAATLSATAAPAPAKAAAQPGAPPSPAAPAAAESPQELLTTKSVNFRVVGDRLQVSARVTLDYYGIGTEIVFQATGRFEPRGAAFVFAPETAYFGSCPLHRLPGATPLLLRTLVHRQKISDELRAAWPRLTALAVENGLVKVATQP